MCAYVCVCVTLGGGEEGLGVGESLSGVNLLLCYPSQDMILKTLKSVCVKAFYYTEHFSERLTRGHSANCNYASVGIKLGLEKRDLAEAVLIPRVCGDW